MLKHTLEKTRIVVESGLQNRSPKSGFFVIATILDEDGIAIRAGHHCCQILHETLGITATARASLGIYNTKEDIDRLNSSINKCKKIFSI